MSQRANQLRLREACENDRPECPPWAQAELEAERRRTRYGLTGLAVFCVIAGVLLWRQQSRARKPKV